METTEIISIEQVFTLFLSNIELLFNEFAFLTWTNKQDTQTLRRRDIDHTSNDPTLYKLNTQRLSQVQWKIVV